MDPIEVRDRIVWLWRSINLLVMIVVLSFLRPSAKTIAIIYGNLKNLNPLQGVGLLAPFVTALIIFYCHHDDCSREGWALKARFRRLRERRYNSDISLISAIITKQSVIAAIAIGALLLVSTSIQQANFYMRLVARISTIGLSCSIVCTLVSILCYDYAARFNWRQDFREDLLRRGLIVEMIGWYLLTLSFVLAIGSFSVVLSLALNFIYGSLLLFYYYTSDSFRTKERLWTVSDEFLRANKPTLIVAAVHRARDCSEDPEFESGAGDLWHIELAAASPLSLKVPLVRAAVEKRVSDEGLRAKLKLVCQ
jgi:hypothetical protein